MSESSSLCRKRGISGLLRLLAVVSLWGLVAPAAFGEELFVETAPVSDRATAAERQEKAAAFGLAARVVRRLEKGSGWQYVVRVDDLEQRDVAQRVALSLSEATGSTVSIYLRAGRDVLPLDEVAVGAATPSSTPRVVVAPEHATEREADVESPVGTAASSEPVAADLPEGDPVAGATLLAAVVRAHGSSDRPAADQLDGAGRIHFRFERLVWSEEGNLRVWHDYWEDAGKVRLEVRILEGEGKDSVAVFLPKGGASVESGGQVKVADEAILREAIECFRPSRVLGRALDLSGIDTERGALYLGSQEQEGRQLAMLLLGDGDSESRVILGVDEADRRVRSLTIATDAGEIGWRFGDYHEVAGVVVPYLVELTREGVSRERIAILELGTPTQVDATVFALPQGR